MVNRQLYTLKFESSRLKKSNYCIEDLTFEQAKKNQEVISVGENQIIRTINDVLYKNNPDMKYRIMDRERLESYYKKSEEIEEIAVFGLDKDGDEKVYAVIVPKDKTDRSGFIFQCPQCNK